MRQQCACVVLAHPQSQQSLRKKNMSKERKKKTLRLAPHSFLYSYYLIVMALSAFCFSFVSLLSISPHILLEKTGLLYMRAVLMWLLIKF